MNCKCPAPGSHVCKARPLHGYGPCVCRCHVRPVDRVTVLAIDSARTHANSDDFRVVVEISDSAFVQTAPNRSCAESLARYIREDMMVRTTMWTDLHAAKDTAGPRRWFRGRFGGPSFTPAMVRA